MEFNYVSFRLENEFIYPLLTANYYDYFIVVSCYINLSQKFVKSSEIHIFEAESLYRKDFSRCIINSISLVQVAVL
jgi:hypothetical protein